MKARIQELNLILEQAKKSVQSILDLRLKGIKNVASKEFQQEKIKLLLLHAQMKSLNRALCGELEKKKAAAKASKDALDAHYLSYQNLLYEKDYFLREIHRNESFQTKNFDSIEFVSKTDFLKNAPVDLTKTKDPHELQLNKLDFEISERKRLCQQRDVLQAELETMESELGKRTTFLDNLPKFLSTLEAASEPLNEFMSAPAANPADQAALYQRSKQLPLPLYVLFTQLEGFRSAFHSADKSFSVQISSARKPDSKQVATPRAGKREDQEPRSRHSADDDEVEEDIDPLLPEGHTVSLSLSFQGTKKTGSKKRSRGGAPGSAQPATQAVDISIEFSYVKAIGVVCVKTTCSTLQDRLLDSLFPGDDGKGPPSASAAALLSSVAPSRTTHAPAYKWAQWLAGIKCLPLASSATPGVPAFTEPTMAQWFAAVRSRITARQLLQAHLSVLSSDSASWKAIPVHPSFAGRFPSGIKTAVASWQEVDEVDEKYTKLLDQSGDFDCFETVYRVNKSHALTIVVAVPVDYPQSAPTFRVVLPEGEPFDNDIDSAEREVNDYSQELVGAEDSRNHLLVHQARRLAMCLDIVYEKESKRHTTNYGRRRRGRDRRLPLVYDWESKSFVHR